jgi:hypothetical protein
VPWPDYFQADPRDSIHGGKNKVTIVKPASVVVGQQRTKEAGQVQEDVHLGQAITQQTRLVRPSREQHDSGQTHEHVAPNEGAHHSNHDAAVVACDATIEHRLQDDREACNDKTQGAVRGGTRVPDDVQSLQNTRGWTMCTGIATLETSTVVHHAPGRVASKIYSSNIPMLEMCDRTIPSNANRTAPAGGSQREVGGETCVTCGT